MDGNSNFTMHTDALYRDITKIEYFPVIEHSLKLVHKAGKVRFWKWLGLIPLIPYKPTKDLYRHKYSNYYGTFSLDKYLHDVGTYDNFMRDNKVYKKARVRVYHMNRENNEYLSFNTNSEALRHIDDIKRKCKECGNILK